MDDTNLENKIIFLESEIRRLVSEIEDMKTLVRKHNHSNIDGTGYLSHAIHTKEGEISTIGPLEIAGETLKKNEVEEMAVSAFSIGPDPDDKLVFSSKNFSMLMTDRQEPYNWIGNWATSTAYKLKDGVHNSGYNFICKAAHTSEAANEPGTAGGDSYWKLLNYYSYLTALRKPAIVNENITVAAADTSLTDSSANFGVNELVGSTIDMVVSSTGQQVSRVITSNTATVVNFSSAIGVTASDITYTIYRPVYLGWSSTPWKRIYIGDDIRLGYGPTSICTRILYGSGSPEDVYYANKGSLYLRTDGSSGTTLYSKTTGTDGTLASGWEEVGAAAANKALSNLTSPTAVNQHLIPGADVTYDLGTSSTKWRYLYVGDISVNNSLSTGSYVDAATYVDGGTGFKVNGTEIVSSSRVFYNIAKIQLPVGTNLY